MTSTTITATSGPAETAATAVEPGTTTRRRAAASCFLGAAALTMAGIIATPWEGSSGTATYLKSLADHPKQAVIAATLLHFGYLLFVPASFAMARLARRGARKLSNVGIAFAVLGAGLSGLLVTDLYDLSIARHLGANGGVPVSDMKGVPLSGLGFMTIGMLSSLGAIVGLTLLAIAMRRARLAPIWPSIAILAGFVVAWGAHDMTRAAAGFGALSVGIAFLGIKVLRMSNQRFAYGSDAR